MYKSVVLIVIAIKIIGIIASSIILPQQQIVRAVSNLSSEKVSETPSATLAVTGRNVYVVWHTNDTVNGNEEVFFRESNDGGKTFGDKVYLSHTTASNSTRIQIDSDGDIVAVLWWESNQTANVPALRVSNDHGETFGPTLKISKNGTIAEGG